jgi:hypothetical protein
MANDDLSPAPVKIRHGEEGNDDSRPPPFVSRDELLILYNMALQCRGRHALEIGSDLGWSSTHIALGGMLLDVVDPRLTFPELRARILHAATACRIPDPVALYTGLDAAKRNADKAGYRWSFIFIHADMFDLHTLLLDCTKYAAEDAAILVRGISSSAITTTFSQKRGDCWQFTDYHTSTTIAVAWRGKMTPLKHVPDPRGPQAHSTMATNP